MAAPAAPAAPVPGQPAAPPSPVVAATTHPEALAAANQQAPQAMASIQNLGKRITMGATTAGQGASEMVQHMTAFVDPKLKDQVAGMFQGVQDAASNAGQAAKLLPGAAQQLAQKIAPPPQAASFGINDVGKFINDSPMQAAAMAIGIPMAVLGIGQGLFGQGGFGSLLMTILGLGGAAFGSGLVNGQGPLGQYAKQIPGMGSVRTLLGMDPPEAGGAPPAAGTPAAAAPVAPAAPFNPAQPHGAQLDAYLQSGGVIDPNEQKQILGSPDLRRYLAGAPANDRDRYLKGMMAGDPKLGRGLARAQQGLGAPSWLGGGRDNVLRAAKQQYNLEPQEFDSMMDSFRRVGG